MCTHPTHERDRKKAERIHRCDPKKRGRKWRRSNATSRKRSKRISFLADELQSRERPTSEEKFLYTALQADAHQKQRFIHPWLPGRRGAHRRIWCKLVVLRSISQMWLFFEALNWRQIFAFSVDAATHILKSHVSYNNYGHKLVAHRKKDILQNLLKGYQRLSNTVLL